MPARPWRDPLAATVVTRSRWTPRPASTPSPQRPALSSTEKGTGWEHRQQH